MRLALDENTFEQMLDNNEAFQQAVKQESENIATAVKEKKITVEVVTEDEIEVEEKEVGSLTEIGVYQTISQEVLSSKIDKYNSLDENQVQISAEKISLPKDLLYHYIASNGANLIHQELDNRQIVIYSKPLRRPLRLDNGSIRLVTEKATNRRDMVLGGTVVSGRYGNNQKQNTNLREFYPNEVLSLKDNEENVHAVITSQALRTNGSSIEVVTVFVPYEIPNTLQKRLPYYLLLCNLCSR